jgi:hypothetical protein
VIAQQSGAGFQPAPTKAGKSIEMLSMGTVSAQEMFRHALESNKVLTWILRLVGFLLMGFGLTMLFRPFSVLADVVPIFGTLVAAGTGAVAFLVAGVLSLVTIALAWLAYRPLLAGLLQAAALAVVALVAAKLKKGKATAR